MIQLSERKLAKWRGKLAKLLALTALALCLGCSGVSSVDGSGSGLSQKECASFQALLLDLGFKQWVIVRAFGATDSTLASDLSQLYPRRAR